ncbi:GNAT family N-acetyltransferase [Aeromicrobium sp.]|uniref:GNAT family N-acetyltransferase n=1 Tax=Aeromicrobium sp. TaxID=1871063 RepID=UPI002FC89D20
MSRRPARGGTTDRTSHVVLADGSLAEIRKLRPSDRSAVTALFESCSEENLYTRFFTLGNGVVVHHLDHLFDPATDTRTYLTLKRGRVIGIADVERCDESTSEIAFMVADDAHGLGVATLLLERAAEDARAQGVAWFVADVLAVNHPMLEVFADAGFKVERHPDHGDVELRMSTDLDSSARTAIASRRARALAHAKHGT